jgi:hypothetical protein
VKRKPSSIFVVLVIILFLFSPSLIDYQVLIEGDFLSSGEKYEDRDLEDFSLDKQLDLAVESSLLSIFSLLGKNLSDLFTGFSLQIPSPAQKPLPLRC